MHRQIPIPLFTLLLLLAALAVLAGPARAATLAVCPSGCDHSTIQDAVNAALDGDRVLINTGLTLTESDIFIGGTRTLTIAGLGAAITTVQADPNEAQAAGRIFLVDAPTTVVLEDMSLRRGDVSHRAGEEAHGGVIRNLGDLTLRRVVTGHSQADRGGVIANAGVLTMEDSKIERGLAFAYGGGLYNSLTGTAVLHRTNVEKNKANTGGGGFFNFGSLTMSDGEILSNAGFFGAGGTSDGTLELDHLSIRLQPRFFTPSQYEVGVALDITGGSASLEDIEIADNGDGSTHSAVRVGNGTTFEMLRSTVRSNAAADIFDVRTPSARIESSTIADNQGRGLQMQIHSAADVVLSTIHNNETVGWGGGIWVNGGTVRLASSTVHGNRADTDQDGFGDGGGIAVYPSGVAELRNSIVAGNEDQTPSGTIAHDCEGTLTSFGHNLIGTLGTSVRGRTSCSVTGDLAGTTTDRAITLAPLADNGGPTPTLALLERWSAAIDTGDPNGCLDVDGATELPLDQRGFPRTGAASSGGPICDKGAFEYGAQPDGGIFSDGFEKGDLSAWI